MNDPLADLSAPLRRSLYGLLIAAALASAAGRILTVQSRDGRTPFLSANDRSRWCTISALVDFGTFEIDQVIRRRGWDTIDKVQHVGRDGRAHFYSSKPTLFPALLAAEYWVIRQLTGATLEAHPFYVARLMLLVTHGALLLVYFLLLVDLIERWGGTTWGRMYVLVAAAWGTFLTTFASTINNHLPAAVCTLAAVWCAVRVWQDGGCRWPIYALAGASAALAFACELPAALLVALLAGGLLWRRPAPTLLAFVPAAAIVLAAGIASDYAAHDSWRPAYAHRQPGDDWYDYEGSYWIDGNRRGVDRGEASPARYALHVLVGHHGVFSLTPIWLLSAAGAWMLARRGDEPRRALAWLVIVLAVVSLAFYLTRPLQDRNYGGVTCGFRWIFWQAPLWLVVMLPAVERLAQRRWQRALCVVLLVLSVLSASYGWTNPWRHPWPYQYGQYLLWWEADEGG